jgi:hypothetical protein
MNPKRKGSAFERDICKALSLWVTDGKNKDVFWRSAMSGGRATVHGRDVRQAGDVCAVAPEGHAFCEYYYVECKHVKTLNFDGLLRGTGLLHKFWADTASKALKRNLVPLLIARQNSMPIIVASYEAPDANIAMLTVRHKGDEFHIFKFDDFIAQKYMP